jgi:uncharacterized membrane protein YbhN (UPF0104 family)
MRAFREGVRVHARWVVAATVLGACVLLLVRQIDLGLLGRALAGADYRLVAAMTLGHMALLLPLKATRWREMLSPMRRLGLATLYRYVLAGCAVGNLLPARAGHAARVVMVRRDGVPVAGAVGTLVLEEMCNTVVLGLLFLPLPLLLELPRRVRMTTWLVMIGAAIGVALSAWLARTGRARPPGLLRRASQGLAVLRSARAAGIVFALTAGIWLLDLGQIALAMRAVAVRPSYTGAALVLLFVNLTNALPVTPGQLGMFEAGAAAACAAVGAPLERGVAVGVLYHMMQFIPETVLGLVVAGPSVLAGARIAAGEGGIARSS